MWYEWNVIMMHSKVSKCMAKECLVRKRKKYTTLQANHSFKGARAIQAVQTNMIIQKKARILDWQFGV